MSDRAIRPANQKRRINTLRVLFALALPAIVFTRSAWDRPDWIFELMEVTGIFLIIAAVLGRFWAILYIGGRKNREVMQDGPYSICRHPLYLFSTMGVVGFGLMLGSLVLTAALGGLAFAILTRTAAREEQFLRAEFGPTYDSYAARVPRIWPRPALFTTRPEVTFRVDTLRGNLFDALVFLSFIPVGDLMEIVKEAQLIPTVAIY